MFCLFWQLLLRKLKRVSFPITWWDQTRREVLGVKDVSDLPIPDEPRKRNTRGCSSSYQPFSLLLMATEGQRKGGLLFNSFAFVDFSLLAKFHPTEPSWPEGDGYPRNYDKRVREQGWEKGQRHLVEKKAESRDNRAREQDERPPEKLSTMPLFPPQSVGPLASSNCVSLPGAAMAKSV